MNPPAADYSFVDPTWNLPSLGNPIMQPGTYDNSQAPPPPHADNGMTAWNNQTNNPRHIPPNTNRGPYPPAANHEQGERFGQPGLYPPPPSQSYQQPEDHFFQSGPAPQSYQQPDERFMQPRFPPSHPQAGERSIPSGPPPQSYQPPGDRSRQQGPPPQSYQPPNNQQRHNGNHSENFDFAGGVNAYDDYSMPKQPRNQAYANEQNGSQRQNFPPLSQLPQRRIQSVEHNPQPFFTDLDSSRESNHFPSQNNRSMETNQFEPKSTARGHPTDDGKLDSTHSSGLRPSKTNIYEYLYGLSAPDAGSYVRTFKNQRRLLKDERVNHRGVMNEYKSFLQNGGFGPAFGATTQPTYQEKLEIERKKKSYSKQVREINQQKIEYQKLVQNSGEHRRNQGYDAPVIVHRRPHELTSQFLFTPAVREFERKVKRDHDANCKCSLHARPFNSSA